MDDGGLLRLMQLASPALPVGGYSYSGGLEAAVEAGRVRDEASALAWLDATLRHGVARFDAPIWLRLHRAWPGSDDGAVAAWNERFVAGRESAELQAETLQMGYSLARLLRELGWGGGALDRLAKIEPSFPAAFSFAAAAAGIGARDGLLAYLWAWCENGVGAAVKLVPLGQTAGQRMLFRLAPVLPAIAAQAETLADDELSSALPLLAILSSCHETQYSRLFRS